MQQYNIQQRKWSNVHIPAELQHDDLTSMFRFGNSIYSVFVDARERRTKIYLFDPKNDIFLYCRDTPCFCHGLEGVQMVLPKHCQP